MRAIRGALGAVLLLNGGPGLAQEAPAPVRLSTEMIVTANPLATEAGASVLRRGGSAVDAMIAAQAMLGLVEPQSSGLGGGAFVVYYDAATDTLSTFDARETAPAAATEDRFLDADGAPLPFAQAWQSGLSVGVPGVPALMAALHARWGLLPMRVAIQPARARALQGFALTARTADQVAGLLARNPDCADRLFFRDPLAFAYFVDGDAAACAAKPAGTVVRNPDYAALLLALATRGPDHFYRGPVAPAIVAAVRGDPNLPGDMTEADLADYRVVERPAVCAPYRGRRVCGMGPPSSGGLAVGQILGILDRFELAGGDGPNGAQTAHLFTQAMRLAFADRNRFVADPDFVTVPAAGMLDPAYLATRAELALAEDMGVAIPGDPPGPFDPAAPAPTEGGGGTSHVSIVDRFGNALSMTTTIESAFGAGVMVPGFGFLLNNQLTDFAFAPRGAGGEPVANRVQPGKRPRSSMAPSIVFDADGEVALVTGSPGGARIIGYVARSIVNAIDFGLDPQQAVDAPHLQNLNGTTTDLEPPIPGVTADYDIDALEAALTARRHEVRRIAQTSGLSVIAVGDGMLAGGADRRRDGAAGGR